MLEKYAYQMQDKCWIGGSSVIASSLDDLESYSDDLALNDILYRKRRKPFTFLPLLLPVWIKFFGSTVYPLFFPTIGSQLIFLISRPLPSVVMGAIEWRTAPAGCWVFMALHGVSELSCRHLENMDDIITRADGPKTTQTKGIRGTCTKKMCVERAWPRLHVRTHTGDTFTDFMIKHVPARVQGAAKHIAFHNLITGLPQLVRE